MRMLREVVQTAFLKWATKSAVADASAHARRFTATVGHASGHDDTNGQQTHTTPSSIAHTLPPFPTTMDADRLFQLMWRQHQLFQHTDNDTDGD